MRKAGSKEYVDHQYAVILPAEYRRANEHEDYIYTGVT